MKNNLRILTISGIAIIGFFAVTSSCKKDKDTTAPAITLNGSGSTTSPLNTAYADPGATATDDKDGNISSKISVSGVSSVNKDSTGIYTITYSVADAAGNTATASRSVRVMNEAEYLAGVYGVVNTFPHPSSAVTNYVDTISVSKTVNNRIWVNKFGSHTGGEVYMNVTSSTTITVPQQVVVCGDTPLSRTFKDTGGSAVNSIDTTGTAFVVTIYFTEIAGPSAQGLGVYTKQ